MSLAPVAIRTVTPDPSNSGCGFDGEQLQWMPKQTFSELAFWLDATAEIEASGSTVERFSNAVVYTDGALAVLQQVIVGNACGLLLSGGTPSYCYAIRIAALLASGETLTWDVALQMTDDAMPWPVINGGLVVKGGVLTLPNFSLPVGS